MPLDALDRLLIKIIIFSFFGIVYLIGLKFYGNDTDFVEDQISTVNQETNSIVAGSESIINHKQDGRDTTTSWNRKWTHKEKVQFIHPEVELLPVSKGEHTVSKTERNGLFAKSGIAFGTILCIEYPILDAPTFKKDDHSFDAFWQKLPYIERIIKRQYKKDPEFKRVWKSFPVHHESKQRLQKHLKPRGKPDDGPLIDHYVRFAFHKMPSHRPWIVYSLIGRVRFHLPPNAMMVVDGKKRGYKAVLIASKDIAKGEEIVTDHFMDWTAPHILQREPDNLYERQVMCKDRGFDLNEEWISFIKQLQDASLSFIELKNLLLKLYPNGMIGKVPDDKFRSVEGCEGMDSTDCIKKVELTQTIETGAIFELETNKKDDVETRGNLKTNQPSTDQQKKCPNDKSCTEHNQKDEFRLINDEFRSNPGNVGQRQLVTHPVHTEFVHSALKLKYFGTEKQYGLITTKRIPFGSVLAIDYPLLLIKDDPKIQFKGTMLDLESLGFVVDRLAEEQSKTDPHFASIWNEELRANKVTFTSWLYTLNEQKRNIPSERVLVNFAKFNTFWFGGLYGHKPIAVYSVLSRINHGNPQNVAAIFGDKTDDFVFVLIATRDLEEGEELTLDYLQNLHLKKGLSPTNEWIRNNRGPEFGWKWTDDLRTVTQKLHFDDISNKEKRKLTHKHLYSNGIIGKQSGEKLKIIKECGGWLTEKECDTKTAIKQDIESGDLFRIIRQKGLPPKWMGEDFEQNRRHASGLKQDTNEM